MKNINFIYEQIEPIIKVFNFHLDSKNFISSHYINECKNMIYNLLKIDWYIPFWDIEFELKKIELLDDINEKIIDEDEDEGIKLLKEIDLIIFEELKEFLYDKEKFLEILDKEDLSLFYLYENGFYQDVVFLSLFKIEDILTKFINFLEMKDIPELSEYLELDVSERRKYKVFKERSRQNYIKKIDDINIDDLSIKESIYLQHLKFFFNSPAQLYLSFDLLNKKNCHLTIINEIPLCRNIFFHGIFKGSDISQKLAVKAIYAYKFFKNFKDISRK